MISSKSIEQILETSRIEEIISEFVVLKKSGQNYKGLSPFSNEKSPSLVVSPVKQLFKDFSSGKGGNVISFLKEHQKMDFVTAVKFLAKRYQIPLEETIQDKEELYRKDKREKSFLLNEQVATYYQHNLKTIEGKQVGLDYLMQRGYSQNIIETFKLGYSLVDVYETAIYLQKQQLDLELAQELGVLFLKGSHYIDRYGGRIIFPILNITGRIAGFGARVLKITDSKAKYINSPESDLYKKSHLLYGLYQARAEIVRQNHCFLVEGYTDVISLFSAGVHNVVASAGTSLTIDQARNIRRFTENVTILFDGDIAGIKAATKGLGVLFTANLNVSIVPLPKDMDPDSLVRSMSSSDVQNYLATNTEDFIRYKIKQIPKTDSPTAKIKIINEIVESLSYISDKIKQEIYIQECVSLLQVKAESIQEALYKYQKSNTPTYNTQPAIENNNLAAKIIPKVETTLLDYLINSPTLMLNPFGLVEEVSKPIRIHIYEDTQKPLYQIVVHFLEEMDQEGIVSEDLAYLLEFICQESFKGEYPPMNQIEYQKLAEIYTKYLRLETTESIYKNSPLSLAHVLLNFRIQTLQKKIQFLQKTITDISQIQQIESLKSYQNMLAKCIGRVF